MPILSLHERAHGDRPALVADAEGRLTYRDLRRVVSQSRPLFEGRDKALVAVFCDRDLDSVTAYLASLAQGHACGFFGDVAEPVQTSLVATYQPEFVVHSPRTVAPGWLGPDDYHPCGFLPGGAVVHRRKGASEGTIFGDLALLLATSGSTDNPKVVRISQANLEANAVSIVAALGIDAAERAITSLPLSHCYGLSVLNSHLVAGASIAVCADRVLSTRFWRTVAGNAVTSFAGVPAVYELLRARRFDPALYPSLTTLTQAGGQLSGDHIGHYADLMERQGGFFWVMYGQTEATARITCLPAVNWRSRPGSVGRVIPGGRLGIEDPDGVPLPDGQQGAIVYYGPNVMLGYAQSRADLAQGDLLGGRLVTGDLGYLLDGYLYLTGRAKRIVKILGYRVELDQVEMAFAAAGPARAVRGDGENIVVFVEGPGDQYEAVRRQLCGQLGLPPGVLTVRPVEAIPVTRTGKADYGALTRLAASAGACPGGGRP
ncbi:MAG: AMP-binding protein [Streptosporangiaceae bacterium]